MPLLTHEGFAVHEFRFVPLVVDNVVQPYVLHEWDVAYISRAPYYSTAAIAAFDQADEKEVWYPPTWLRARDVLDRLCKENKMPSYMAVKEYDSHLSDYVVALCIRRYR